MDQLLRPHPNALKIGAHTAVFHAEYEPGSTGSAPGLTIGNPWIGIKGGVTGHTGIYYHHILDGSGSTGATGGSFDYSNGFNQFTGSTQPLTGSGSVNITGWYGATGTSLGTYENGFAISSSGTIDVTEPGYYLVNAHVSIVAGPDGDPATFSLKLMNTLKTQSYLRSDITVYANSGAGASDAQHSCTISGIVHIGSGTLLNLVYEQHNLTPSSYILGLGNTPYCSFSMQKIG